MKKYIVKAIIVVLILYAAFTFIFLDILWPIRYGGFERGLFILLSFYIVSICIKKDET